MIRSTIKKIIWLPLVLMLFVGVSIGYAETIELRQSTEAIVRIGGFFDVTDKVTPETGITLSAADQAELLKQNGVSTIDISTNAWAGITGCDGHYNLTLTENNTDTLGDATVVVQDVSECTPVKISFSVITQEIWDFTYGSNSIAYPIWEALLTGGTYNTPTSAGKRLRQVIESGVYESGSVWIDTINGTAGTDLYENGTNHNPVDSLADAITISSSLGFYHFELSTASSITLTQSFNGYGFHGHNWGLALGGQSISNTHIYGATITGIGTAVNPPEFTNCDLNSATIPPSSSHHCALSGDLIIGSGYYVFHNCFSAKLESGMPSIDYGAATGDTNLKNRDYVGGFTVKNMGQSGTDVLTFAGYGNLIIDASNIGGTINLRGAISYTDNSGGAVTINDDTRYDVAQINAAADTALTDYDPPTRTEATSDKAEIITEIAAIPTALTGAYGTGVLQNSITVIDSSPQEMLRGDVKTFYFNLGTSWPLTGKKVYFILKINKTDDDSAAIVNRVCTITDEDNGSFNITLTADESATVGRYNAEAEVRNTDESNPQTPRQFNLIIKRDVRQGN